MLSILDRFDYLFDAARRFNEPVVCPFCKTTDAKVIDRKYMFARLFECSHCHLYFRHPVDSVEHNRKFYQKNYVESDSFTTNMPSAEELDELKNNSFNVSKDRSAGRFINLFNALFPRLDHLKIVDYGTSWGYLSYQFRMAGLDVQSFEISEPRAAFGNKHLGLEILTDQSKLSGTNDIFFSSHVIEHVPSIGHMLNLGKSLLKPEGLFIATCPNGSRDFRKNNEHAFHHSWGKVHPNYLNRDFYQHIFRENPYYMGSNEFNYREIKQWDKQSQVISDLGNEELLVIVKVNEQI
jgi:2-polyprenyl-3-methyl-5-hydroxy-6-metoxy-1,4-benzoquinol methylase